MFLFIAGTTTLTEFNDSDLSTVLNATFDTSNDRVTNRFCNDDKCLLPPLPHALPLEKSAANEEKVRFIAKNLYLKNVP